MSISSVSPIAGAAAGSTGAPANAGSAGAAASNAGSAANAGSAGAAASNAGSAGGSGASCSIIIFLAYLLIAL